jgi:hypothetical protein
LPFQISDLLFGIEHLLFRVGDLLLGVGDSLLAVGDSLIPFDYLLAELLNLTLLPLNLPLQFFPTGRMGVRLPTRGYLLVVCALSGSGIHPQSS